VCGEANLTKGFYNKDLQQNEPASRAKDNDAQACGSFPFPLLQLSSTASAQINRQDKKCPVKGERRHTDRQTKPIRPPAGKHGVAS
jgi:hypothetical protein